MIGKKGVSIWLSWVLLTAFMTALGLFMYEWMSDYTGQQTDEMQTRTDYQIICEDIGISIDNVCQNTQTLYTNISNRHNVRIDQIVIRIYDIYDNPQTKTRNVTIDPEETLQLSILKQGITRHVEFVPAVLGEDGRVLCENAKVVSEDVQFC